MFIKHDRQSIRLVGFDYTRRGAYFVTICVFERAHIFGRIREGIMEPNRMGEIVLDEWRKTPIIRPYVDLDEYVLMPNHFHGILWLGDPPMVGTCTRLDDGGTWLDGRGTARRAPTVERFGKPVAGSIPTIIRAFKSAATKRIHETRPHYGQIWQRNYYERIIRSEEELYAVRRYIRDNPAKWGREE
jgi:REP element-mobilizing transposase RayT